MIRGMGCAQLSQPLLYRSAHRLLFLAPLREPQLRPGALGAISCRATSRDEPPELSPTAPLPPAFHLTAALPKGRGQPRPMPMERGCEVLAMRDYEGL